MKSFSSVESAILPNQMACSILSAMKTKSVKCCAELLTKYSKYGALKVLENKLIISFSNKEGLTCAIASRHLWAYYLMDSLLSFFIACKLDLLGAHIHIKLILPNKGINQILPLFTLVLSNHIYHVRATSLKLSWKKWINSFSSLTTSVILLQYALKRVTRHWVPYI